MRALLAAALCLTPACASTQRLAAQSIAPPSSELVLRLDPDEDPAHALSVATRRLGAEGITRAEVTAVTGSLTVRVPPSSREHARGVLAATPWVRGRYVDARVDLRPLVAGAPPDIREGREAVALMPGFEVTETTVESGSREALAARLAAFPELARDVVLVRLAPSGAWRAIPVAAAVMARGAEVARCRSGATAREVVIELARAPGMHRRWVLELNGAPRALARGEASARVLFDSADEAEAFRAQCARGLLGGPVRVEDQRPSQGTGSSVAP